MIPDRALRREALVDTGATMTVVRREVAEDAELLVAWKRPDTFQTADGREVRFWPGEALVQAEGCPLIKMTVAVADTLADDDVSVILGHDYMQRTGMVVGPRDRLAGCTTYTRRKGKVVTTRNPKRVTRTVMVRPRAGR